jgi:transcriptional regulator with XRE-family HTH domain
LAKLLDVGQQAVSNWEQDRAMPVGAVKQRLSRLLGVAWEVIETGLKFRVPDEPPGATLGGEGILATEESTKRPVMLPAATEGEAWMVVVGSDERTPVDAKHLSDEIRQALKEGATVWVVVKRPETKPSRPSPKKPTPVLRTRKATKKP